jgi:mono/diheme cytochrome c family protein
MIRGATRMIVSVTAGVGVLMGALAPAAWAADTAQATSPGKAMYLKYCSACHGESGKGDGVVSGFLQPKPTDLTQIAKKNQGKFPFMTVVEGIDGTHTVRAHGDPAMPVWGEIFHQDTAASMARQAEVRGKVMLITEYVRSIQAK